MKKTLPILLVALLSLSACTVPSKSGDNYSREQARRVQTVRTGVIESLRPVKIEGAQSGGGTLIGGLVGGVGGGAIGQGYGSVAGAVLGAVAGGLIGSAIEKESGKRNALEITVILDSGGEMLAVVQEESTPNEFRVGDKVRLLFSPNGESRVTHR